MRIIRFAQNVLSIAIYGTKKTMNKKYYREGMRDKIEYKYQCMTCDFHHVSDSKTLYMHCPRCRIKYVKSKMRISI